MSEERTRPAPSERFNVDSMVVDIEAEVRALRAEHPAAPHGHRQKTLYKHGPHTTALFVMDAGAHFREHRASATVTVHPVRGEIEMTVEGKPRRLSPGSLMVIAPDVPHDVRGPEESVFLLQVTLEQG